jgi:DNA-binding transcriptional LysR family regulator
MLDATRLRVLVAVARYGSVTGAAQALNYAQPSISHHIARLEAETGAKLMERAGRGVKLTEAGQLLADRAEEIIGRLDAAEAELATHVGLRQDRVRLAAFGSALSTLVAAASATLHTGHVDAGLQLIQAEPGEALRMLRAGEVDVALVYRFLRDGIEFDSPTAEVMSHSADSQPAGQPVFDEPMYLITAAPKADVGGQLSEPIELAANPAAEWIAADPAEAAERTANDSAEAAERTANYPAEAAKLTANDPADAAQRTANDPARAADERAARAALLAAHAGERWISAGEQCDELMLDLCREAGLNPDVALRSADFVVAQSLVAAGLGVTIAPGLALRAARHPEIHATPLPGICRQILAITYQAAPDSPAARRLIDAIATTRPLAPTPATPAPATPTPAARTPAVPVQAARLPSAPNRRPPGTQPHR